jgi:redox-sensitive bicupin YhaK (pirin superfamily)
MKKTLHKADTRGVAERGWLSSRHTFSFANYHDPQRMRFGLLRVVNDDVVQPSMGFGTHPHENMEIISIPLAGELRHEDSMGNIQIIKTGEIQIMSAGTGVTHSEYNGSDSEVVNFLQIWVLPEVRDIEPRYDQKLFSADQRQGRLQNIVSPDQNDGGVWINQQAWFWLGDFKAGQSNAYTIKRGGNGVYFFVLEGAVVIAGEQLERRDGIGIEGVASVDIEAIEECQLLVIDVPVQLMNT